MKLFAFKPHPDVVLKNILTQPHSDSVITMTSTGRWGLLESWFSPGFGGEVSAGSQDRLSLHPSHHAIVFPSSSLATPLSFLKYVQLILESFTFICLLCVWVGRAHTMEDRRPLSACWPHLPTVCRGIWTQVNRLGNKCFYWPSHLTSPPVDI